MKTINILKFLLSVTFLLVLPLISCTNNELDKNEEYLDHNLIKSKKRFNDLRAIYATAADDVRFSIEKVERQSEILTITVRGGCSPNAFKFYWDGAIFYSQPGQIYLLLEHDESSLPYDKNAEYIVKVDLSKLAEKADLNNNIVHVLNGSQQP
jgi:hypothetical protein